MKLLSFELKVLLEELYQLIELLWPEITKRFDCRQCLAMSRHSN